MVMGAGMDCHRLMPIFACVDVQGSSQCIHLECTRTAGSYALTREGIGLGGLAGTSTMQSHCSPPMTAGMREDWQAFRKVRPCAAQGRSEAAYLGLMMNKLNGSLAAALGGPSGQKSDAGAAPLVDEWQGIPVDVGRRYQQSKWPSIGLGPPNHHLPEVLVKRWTTRL